MTAPTGKTFYELCTDAVKLVGAGNATGLLAAGAAINSGKSSLLWLKFSAGSFAVGILLFAVAYGVFFYAWIFGEENFDLIKKMEADGVELAPTEIGHRANRFFIGGLALVASSIATFLIRFLLAFVYLIRM